MENEVTYKVKAGNFEGPLELLLSLVEERKFFVNDLSLAEVTNEYITYVNNLSKDNALKHISDVSSFVVVAATLILIKSKSLLPNLNLTTDETEKIQNLEDRLRLYQIIKNASIDIKTQFGVQVIFSAPERNFSDPVWSPDKNVTPNIMLSSINSVFDNLPKKSVPLPEIEVKKVISIEEMIDNLTERIQNAISFSFKDFSSNFKGENVKEIKTNVIVSFLAMLELVREGIIDVIQNSNFEDITIEKQRQVDITNHPDPEIGIDFNQ